VRVLGATPQAVSAAELKRARHLPDAGDDDDTINAYLMAAQAVVETACACPMGQRTAVFTVVAQGWARWWFPVRPVVSIDKIEVSDGRGTLTDLAIDRLQLWSAWHDPQLLLSGVPGIVSGAELQITAVVGHDVGDWPLQMTQAVKLIAGEWYEAGIAPEGAALSELSFAAKNLIRQVRYLRPVEWGAV
jgi:uncharacterized phiE125 gp8 family phage protein